MIEFIAQYGFHLAYLLIASSFVVKDILWLRCLSIVASFALVLTWLTRQDSSWTDAVVIWNLLFVCINGFHVFMLVFGERTVHFNDEEKELYETLFANFSKLQFQKVLRLGRWQAVGAGESLAREGDYLAEVMLISNGAADIMVGDRIVSVVRDGQFIGEMSYLTHEPASDRKSVV